MEDPPHKHLQAAGFGLAVGEYLLRPWTPEDAQVMAAIVADPAIPRWTFLPYGMTAAEAARWIEKREAQRSAGSGVALAIEACRGGELLGCVGLADLEAELGPEAYYWLGGSARGRGVASSALGRICQWAFDVADVARVRLYTEPGNVRSRRVAERVGFVREGELRRAAVDKEGRRGDLLLFGLLPEDLTL